MKFSYGLEFNFTPLGGKTEDCRIFAPKADTKLPLPKVGESVTFVWAGEQRNVRVKQWRFDYKVNKKSELTGLHIGIELDNVTESDRGVDSGKKPLS